MLFRSVVVAHGLSSYGSRALECRLSSCGTQALLLHGMWDLPGPGLEPMSPALAGGFLTTVPPGKSFLSSWDAIYFFFLPNCSGNSSTILNSSGESDALVLFLTLGESFQLFTIDCGVSCGF